MESTFGKLLTAYALYSLTGPGLIVVYFVGSCWYITVVWGWMALGVYLVISWIIVQCLIRALANWIKRNSIYSSQEAWERHCKAKRLRHP